MSSTAPAPARPGYGGDVVAAASLLSVGYVLALWTANRGLQALGGGAGPALTSAGRLLGLVAADMLLLQCLMMARIPWAERAFGQDRLARWHRVLGFTSFGTLLGHVAVITVAYAVTDHEGLPRQAWDLVWTYPGLLLATAGTVMIVGVTVTSLRAARRRLRYESWHLLHLYAYLGLGLALPHQVWTGTDFVSSPWARAYWWTLWAAAAAAVLAYRVGVPAWLSYRHAPRVAAVVPEAPGVVSVHLAGRRLDRLGARAGQFLVLRFLDGPGWSRGNPYSLSAAPCPAGLRVTIADAGDGSARAARLRPGTRVLLEGPYGRLTAAARTHPGRPVVLLGAGVGVTPLRALLDELGAPGGGTTLVVRARSERDLIFAAELDAFAAAGVRVVPLVGPRARPGSWLPRHWAALDDAAALRRLVPDIAAAEVYVCGPPAWAGAVTAALSRAGVPGERVHQERFAW
jgi:ferredoxin-NADP reductase/DMSO/TMAO reductase YedYZ heme-binding membrane subunit